MMIAPLTICWYEETLSRSSPLFGSDDQGADDRADRSRPPERPLPPMTTAATRRARRTPRPGCRDARREQHAGEARKSPDRPYTAILMRPAPGWRASRRRCRRRHVAPESGETQQEDASQQRRQTGRSESDAEKAAAADAVVPRSPVVMIGRPS